jgi:hypothetical protein
MNKPYRQENLPPCPELGPRLTAVGMLLIAGVVALVVICVLA